MQKRKTLTWALILALGASTFAGAALNVTPPKLEVREHELPNGLRILLHEDHSTPLVHLQVWYHVGSKNERPGRNGFAHLFEHLMFKGSENVGVEEHKQFVQSIGGRYNAATGFDRTHFLETFPSHYLERVLWMEADRLRSLHVPEETFLSEREVVKEERRVGVEDAPYGRLHEVILDAAYTTHPYRRTVIGVMDDLNAATIEDVREFYRTYYVPQNATLVIAGDFAPAEALAWVEKYFGPIPRGEPISRDVPQEPPQESERRVLVYDANAPLPLVILAYHVPEDGHPDIWALNIAGNILSAGQSSRLYRKMVYEEQIALQAGGEILALEEPGLFGFLAFMNADQTPETGEKALREEVERLRNEPVSAEELEQAKNQFISQLVFGRQTCRQKAEALAHAKVILGDVSLVNRQLAEYQGVTAADIQRVAKKYFTTNNQTVIYMLPEAGRPASGEPESAAASGGAIDKEVDE
ncbi:MAG: insulinase family protein [bacterium]|nr:insulinase family protein [bacterium]